MHPSQNIWACDLTKTLDLKTRSELAKQWNSYANSMITDSTNICVRDSLINAANALKNNDIGMVRDALHELTSSMPDIRYRNDLAKPIWQLLSWANELDIDNSYKTFNQTYASAYSIVTSKDYVPEDLHKKAKQYFLDCLPRSFEYEEESNNRYLNLLVKAYKNRRYFDDDEEKLVGACFLEFIDNFSKKQNAGEVSSPYDAYTFTMIIDAAMMQLPRNKFLERAHEIRKYELKEHMEKNPAIKNVMGHASVLAKTLDI